LALWSELEERPVLPHRLHSLISVASLYIPRAWYPDKPFMYANHLTCHAFNVSPRFMIWGLTTSILDEAIANLSWLGVIAGPLLLGTFCAVADAARSPMLRITGFLACLLFMATNLPSFMPLFLVWSGGLLWERFGTSFTLAPGRMLSR
jgi:hypothetical protein